MMRGAAGVGHICVRGWGEVGVVWCGLFVIINTEDLRISKQIWWNSSLWASTVALKMAPQEHQKRGPLPLLRCPCLLCLHIPLRPFWVFQAARSTFVVCAHSQKKGSEAKGKKSYNSLLLNAAPPWLHALEIAQKIWEDHRYLMALHLLLNSVCWDWCKAPQNKKKKYICWLCVVFMLGSWDLLLSFSWLFGTFIWPIKSSSYNCKMQDNTTKYLQCNNVKCIDTEIYTQYNCYLDKANKQTFFGLISALELPFY